MIEVTGNLWDYPATVFVLSTNGAVKYNGEAVMGRGCAKQAKDRYPGLAMLLGNSLKTYGNHVSNLGSWDGKIIISFPVKHASETCKPNKSNVVKHMQKQFEPGQTVPGWACVADRVLILRSAMELVKLVDEGSYSKIVCPRFGCGAGELDWEDIRSVLAPILDDRFHVIIFK